MPIEIHENRTNPVSFQVGTNKVMVNFSDELLQAWVGVPLDEPVEAMPNSAWNDLMDSIEFYLKKEGSEMRLKDVYQFSITDLREMKEAKDNAN